jgi:hypothetical protein
MIKGILTALAMAAFGVSGFLIARELGDNQEAETNRPKAEYAEQVANVYVSAYPVVPWADIADKLEPKNSLSIAEARAMATQTTAVEVEQHLLTRSAGLAIGLQSRTESSATTPRPGPNEQTPPTSANVPTSSGAPVTPITTSTLTPDLNKAPLVLGVNGNTTLTAGTALYQPSLSG